ncbi:DUF1365 domain-containing protein [Amycolatopsis samaneae]|uniref:DUF1365 domain-containing protein n=1 Tax=Amycolatopsis samaneae TaxID=664691 RepID=A0ABW5GKB6_9PSEU
MRGPDSWSTVDNATTGRCDTHVAPALYTAEIRHLRRTAPARDFTHRIHLWLVDPDNLPRLPWWLAPFARFRAADHLGSPDRSIRENLDHWLAGHGIDLDGGQVLMLTHARVAGYVFNPITLYWCHRPDGMLACVVAEVHNTYHQRHCYLLIPDADGHARTPKQFYVSPFLDPDGDYMMRVPRPGARLAITITLNQGGDTTLVAGLRGTRRAATPTEVVKLLLAQPFLPQRVSALIRRHGIALWVRRTPIRPRPHARRAPNGK